MLGLGDAGVAAAEALAARRGAESVRIWDDSKADGVRATREALTKRGATRPAGIEEALEGVALVVKSPGAPFDHPLLLEAGRREIPILDELEVGWRLSTQPVVAITGTNGKSTTTTLVYRALHAAGRNPLLAGNVESYRGSFAMSALPPEHDGWVVAEVSSYQAQASPEFLPAASVLTNLTPDHLHRHGSMEAYGNAKRRIFVRGDRAVPLAVLNADDPFGRRLSEEVRERGGRALTYGEAGDADFRIKHRDATLLSGRVLVDAPTGPVAIDSRLPGAHNAANLAAAFALAAGLELPRDAAIEAFQEMVPLPGRFEPVHAGQPFDVVVDFSKSPDGARRALETARELAGPRGGRIVVVLGAVGVSTPAIREETGRVARAAADHLVLCASSYRAEHRLTALQGLLAGARQTAGGRLEVVLDRRAAIARALELAHPGDLVAILGRGGLTRMSYDARGGHARFDDREVAKELLGELGFGRPGA